MKEENAYNCPVCGGSVRVADGAEAPECCGRKMLKGLPVCTKQTVAEHYRLEDDNEPCDDGREGT